MGAGSRSRAPSRYTAHVAVAVRSSGQRRRTPALRPRLSPESGKRGPTSSAPAAAAATTAPSASAAARGSCPEPTFGRGDAERARGETPRRSGVADHEITTLINLQSLQSCRGPRTSIRDPRDRGAARTGSLRMGTMPPEAPNRPKRAGAYSRCTSTSRRQWRHSRNFAPDGQALTNLRASNGPCQRPSVFRISQTAQVPQVPQGIDVAAISGKVTRPGRQPCNP
jgi:hypothetical protein